MKCKILEVYPLVDFFKQCVFASNKFVQCEQSSLSMTFKLKVEEQGSWQLLGANLLAEMKFCDTFYCIVLEQ